MKRLFDTLNCKLTRYFGLETKQGRLLTTFVVLLVPMLLMAAVTQIDLTSQVKGILPAANGGTGSAYLSVAGLTATRTVTFPDANGTVMYTSTGVAASQLPVPSATTLGGVQSKSCVGSGHIVTIGTDGVPVCSSDASGPNFSDNEVPTGTIDGSNAAFTFAHTPTGTSLQFFKNGQLMIGGGADYTLSTATATFVTGAKPKTGDVLIATYRY